MGEEQAVVLAPTIIVVPTLNEAENVTELVRRIGDAIPGAHLMLVDDASADGTPDAAELAFGGREGYRVHRRRGIRGLGKSYVEGFGIALNEGYGSIVQMDADLSHDPAAIPSLLDGLRSADCVIGSRYCPGGGVKDWAPHRIALSRWANAYVRAVTGLPVADVTAGFRAWRAEALRTIDIQSIRSGGYSFQVETTVRAHCAGLRIVETPITFTDRRRGSSKVTFRVMAESLVMPWRLRRRISELRKEARWRSS